MVSTSLISTASYDEASSSTEVRMKTVHSGLMTWAETRHGHSIIGWLLLGSAFCMHLGQQQLRVRETSWFQVLLILLINLGCLNFRIRYLPFTNEVANALVKHIKDESEKSSSGEVDLRSIAGRY